MAYRKTSVEFHCEGYHGAAAPAVNVKVYGSVWDVLHSDARLADAVDDTDDLDAFREYATNLSEDRWDSVWQHTIESGWEMLQSDAEEIFGVNVKVRSEGRSGGWCCVDGLPDLEDWDAIMLGKWRKFERWAKGGAENIPAEMVSILYINDWEWERQERQQRELNLEEATMLGVPVG